MPNKKPSEKYLYFEAYDLYWNYTLEELKAERRAFELERKFDPNVYYYEQKPFIIEILDYAIEAKECALKRD